MPLNKFITILRIAIVHRGRAKVGGAEVYLENVIPALVNLGNELVYWHEVDDSAAGTQIVLPKNVSVWCPQKSGVESALQTLREWRSDLIYAHGLQDISLEAEMSHIAPVVFYAHAYYGSCISGTKSFKFPRAAICDRPFGWPCLLHYYPRRCGGLSPVTMWNEYRLQSQRLDVLRSCSAIVTNSVHMAAEYYRYGLKAHHVPYPIPPLVSAVSVDLVQPRKACWRLLFIGRMHATKGGNLLLDAAAQVVAQLQTPVQVTFAGGGPDREAWEQQAGETQARTPGLSVMFVGQLAAVERDRLMAVSDLLVVPSLWPEPFGLVGPEAGLHGVPAAAFDVGGISDWLSDGINGCLAPANSPTAAGLAEAIVRCLHDPATYARMRCNAAEMAKRFNMETHLAALTKVFRYAVAATISPKHDESHPLN